MRTALLGVVCFVPALPAMAAAQPPQTVLTPLAVFSVHDEPVDGLGDSFNTFTGLIRTQSTRADRAMHEFDVTPLFGAEIATATLSGTVNVNNAADNGPRTFDFALYVGNGVADLTDYEIPATVVGSDSYHPPFDSSFDYSFDVTAMLQTMLDCTTPWVGLKVIGTSNPNFPNILSSSASQLTVTVTPPSPGIPVWTDLGFATPGANGAPQLFGTGVLSSTTTGRLTICHQEPLLPGLIVFGFSRIDFPILGATFVPFPDVAGTLDANAIAMQSFDLVSFGAPGGVAGQIYFQYWSLDPTAPQGAAVSNALQAAILP